MMRLEKALALLLGSWLSGQAVYGVTYDPGSADRDYQVFVERNPFGLKPPPPPPTNAPVAVAPKDEVLLTGITSIGGLRAYFMSKPPQGKTPEYYSLGPDEKKDGMEVLEIDPLAKSVRVRSAGVENVMTFASNGVKPPPSATAPPPGTPQAPGAGHAPGMGGVPGMNTPPPGPAGNPGNPSGSGRVRTIPSRNAGASNFGGNPGGAPMGGGGYLSGGPGSPTVPPAPPNPNAAVQDALMMELQKRSNPNVSFPPSPVPMPMPTPTPTR